MEAAYHRTPRPMHLFHSVALVCILHNKLLVVNRFPEQCEPEKRCGWAWEYAGSKAKADRDEQVMQGPSNCKRVLAWGSLTGLSPETMGVQH